MVLKVQTIQIPKQGLFNYRSYSYSAGHVQLDTNKHSKRRHGPNRDRKTSWILGDPEDSQIGKGVWEGNWKDPPVQSTKET